jgi:hypothetical protein
MSFSVPTSVPSTFYPTLAPTTEGDQCLDGEGVKNGDVLYTLYVNVVVFAILMALFEVNRHVKGIYLKRVQRKYQVIKLYGSPYIL